MTAIFYYVLPICSLLVSSCSWAFPVKPSFKGAPIILIPGDLGSQLVARLNKSDSVHYLCYKHTDGYYTIWLDLKLLVPYVLGCWADNIRLIFNETTNATQNRDGVEIEVQGFGNTTTIEWLNPSQISIGHYFASIVANATQWGYIRGKSIRGAPYDFRKAPNEASDYFDRLKILIEETYYSNGNKKVVTIGHSMGNSYMLFFYNNQHAEWKKKFIRSHISLAAPWGGSAKTLKIFASGDNLNHYRLLLNPLTLRDPQRSFTSTAFLMPSDKFWSPEETLIRTSAKNYTVNDYETFFKDIDHTDGIKARELTKGLIYDLDPPNVEVHCLFGTGVGTPIQFNYESVRFPDDQPETLMGDGDGSVNLRSLQGCMRWIGVQKESVVWKAFPNEEHVEMLRSAEVIDYIRKVVFSIPPHFNRDLEFVY